MINNSRRRGVQSARSAFRGSAGSTKRQLLALVVCITFTVGGLLIATGGDSGDSVTSDALTTAEAVSGGVDSMRGSGGRGSGGGPNPRRALRSIQRSTHIAHIRSAESDAKIDSGDCVHGKAMRRFTDAVVRPPPALLALIQSSASGNAIPALTTDSREQWDAAIDFVSHSVELASDQTRTLTPSLDIERLSNAPLRWPPLVTLDLSSAFYTAVHHTSLAAASEYRSTHSYGGPHPVATRSSTRGGAHGSGGGVPISTPTYRVVAAGLSRSGSTWQFNCLRFILRAAFGDYSLPAVTHAFRARLKAESAAAADPAKLKSIEILRADLIELERAMKSSATSVPASIGLSEFIPSAKPEWAETAYDPKNQRSTHYPIGHPRLLDCLHNSTVCVIKVHGFVPEIPHVADAIFTTHRDVRDLISSIRHLSRGPDRTQWHNFGPPFGPPTDTTTSPDGQSSEFNNLKNAFSWYTRWVPLSVYDMEYEDLMSDELFEIRMHIRLLGFSEAGAPPVPNSEYVSRVSSAIADDSDSMPSLSPQPNPSRDASSNTFASEPPAPISVDPYLVQRLIRDAVSYAHRSEGWQSGSGLHTRHVSEHRHLLRDLTAFELREMEYHYGDWLRWKRYPIYYPDFAAAGATGATGATTSPATVPATGGSGFVERMRRRHSSDATASPTAGSSGPVPAAVEVNTRQNVMRGMSGHHLLWQTRNQTTLLSEWDGFLQSQYATRFHRAHTLNAQMEMLQSRKASSRQRRVC